MMFTRQPLSREKALAKLAALCARAEYCTGDMEDKMRRWGLSGDDIKAHTDTVALDRLIAFTLTADGGPSEGACEELRSRFLESPHTVLAYLVLMGDQTVSSDDSTPAAEFICGQIASADAAWHDGSEEFAQVMESCKADYPEGPAAELLSKMETAHEASLERNK